MTRTENIRRSFQRFISDEGLYRLLDEILFVIDIEGTVESVREQLHKVAEEEFVKCQHLGESGDRIQQEYLSLLDKSLSLVYPAVKLRFYEDSADIKKELRNFITYVVRNSLYIFDFIDSNKWELTNRLFYFIQRVETNVLAAEHICNFAEQAFDDMDLTEPEKEEAEVVKERLHGLHYFVISAIGTELKRKCEKAVDVVTQIVTARFQGVIEKLFRVEKAIDSLREFYYMNDEWINEVFGEDSISYLADAIDELEIVVYSVAPHED